MKVIVGGRITFTLQEEITRFLMRPAGAGELQAAFELLKQKLASEGLFDQKYKKPMPVLSKKIGIITAIHGAAFQPHLSYPEMRHRQLRLLSQSFLKEQA